MITVEVSAQGEKVEIILDQAGLDELQAHLDGARRDGDAHLRAPSWAGTELEDTRSSVTGDVTVAKDLTIRVFK